MSEKVFENIKTRRSVKRYKPDPVPMELIEKVVDAGTFAATGRNRQAPIILVITNKETRDKISAQNAAILGATGDPFYGAPVILIVLADKTVNTRVYDGSLVLGNMMNAAHSLGLGSCWIHRAKEEFQAEYGKNLLKTLGIEGEWEGIGHCLLGYADGPLPEARPRKDGLVHYV